MTAPLRSISLAGSQLGAVHHVCAFFANDDEEYRVLFPFIQQGLRCGDKAVYIVNHRQQQEHLRRLSAEGIDIKSHQESGQLEIKNNTDVYLEDGHFDQERMIATFEGMASACRKAGKFPLSRVVCQMDWASEDQTHIEDVIEFESRVNEVWCRYDDAVICTYRLATLSGDAVIDIMRTHPMVIIGGQMQQNPFFTPPEEFVREFRERRSGRTNLH